MRARPVMALSKALDWVQRALGAASSSWCSVRAEGPYWAAATVRVAVTAMRTRDDLSMMECSSAIYGQIKKQWCVNAPAWRHTGTGSQHRTFGGCSRGCGHDTDIAPCHTSRPYLGEKCFDELCLATPCSAHDEIGRDWTRPGLIRDRSGASDQVRDFSSHSTSNGGDLCGG